MRRQMVTTMYNKSVKMNFLFNYLQNYFPAHLLDSEHSDKAVTEKAQKAKTILQQVPN